MPATRMLPTDEAVDLIALVRQIAAEELAPRSAEAEATETFPREVFRMLGRTGLLGLPYPEEHGGGGQPYEVYLQVLEEVGAVWSSVGVGISVHALSCFGLATAGTEEQRARWLPEMLGGELLGAYCLSEPHAGSDPAAMRTRARRDGDEYVISGAKAWTTHGGHADFYKVMARTGDARGHISCFLVPADSPGLSADAPEHKMGLTGSATATMRFDDVRVSADRLLGAEGDGLKIALAGLDAGRLGIAAVAPAWPRAPWTGRWPTPRSGRRSGSGSSTTRAWPSCWPTWRPPSSPRVPRCCTPPGSRTPVCPTAARPRSPSWSRPTTPCG